MVVANMDGPRRDQVLKLMEEKTRIEEEIKQLTTVLETNQVGLTDELVDNLGYPRNDVDVYQVRHARHRIICLQNDHKALMRQIERGLHALHAHQSGGASSQNDPQSGNAESLETSSISTPMRITNGFHHDGAVAPIAVASNSGILRPIAKVNLVSPGSPAETAGIVLDDEILQFGSINAGNFRNITQIGELVANTSSGTVQVKVLRGPQKNVLNISLQPRAWSGRGLVGCNIVPL